jgi:hypothetical protein
MADKACTWDGKACELIVVAEACKTLMEKEKCVAFMACAWDMSKDKHCIPRPRPNEVGGTQVAAPAHGPIETSKQVFSKVPTLFLFVCMHVIHNCSLSLSPARSLFLSLSLSLSLSRALFRARSLSPSCSLSLAFSLAHVRARSFSLALSLNPRVHQQIKRG